MAQYLRICAPDEDWGFDCRGIDLRSCPSDQLINKLPLASFDSKTLFPHEMEELVHSIFELGKDPGMNIRDLHDRGIDGRGVGIAIIDDTLLVNHVEYADQLRLYEEQNIGAIMHASMHGAAVASLAVGKNVGVAPAADLYYIACNCGDWSKDGLDFEIDYTYTAKAIDRIVQINEELPENRKIRVISISKAWLSNEKGYDALQSSIRKAKMEGIATIGVNHIGLTNVLLWGLHRDLLDNPNLIDSYEPVTLPEQYMGDSRPGEQAMQVRYILIPMEGRTFASPTDVSDYTFESGGGASWTVPYLAGLYALACQCDQNITFDEFIDYLLSTGQGAEIPQNGEWGILPNPASIAELRP